MDLVALREQRSASGAPRADGYAGSGRTMEANLSESQCTEARRALLGDRSDALIDLVVRVHFRMPTDGVDSATWTTAEELGWVDASRRALTRLGDLVADPIREYHLWIERDRTIHGGRTYPALAVGQYAGKSVLEPGSGFGCNLFALSQVPGRFVGLEPIALYRQFTPIFAEREGIRCPEIVGGRCESLPFRDGEFDVVLCYSAHQYMDIKVALREMVRVIKPGGQLRIIGGTLPTFLAGSASRLVQMRSLRGVRYDAITVANTVAYELAGRRLVVPKGASATTAPIYPTQGFMRRQIEGTGLVFRDDLSRRVEIETCFIADKVA